VVLAQAPGGLSCYLLPRVRPDGTRNGMRLQRLKDKLGNRSNASAEVEYDEALAWLAGEEGRGVRTIIEMVNMTRLDCVLGTATGMRTGLTIAAHHAAHRTAFGRTVPREAPLASIWEGSGNVAALDALRALTRQPESAEAFFAELDLAAGADARLDQAVTRLRKEIGDPSEARARQLAEAMALVLQGALL